MEDLMKVKIKKLNEKAVIPAYAQEGDAGMDVTCTSYEYDYGTSSWMYHTGLSFEVPKGYVMLIFPRSSNRKTDCYLANSVGVLDSGYRGELMLAFKNRDSILSGPFGAGNLVPPYTVGERVGQIMILPYPQIEFKEVAELSSTERGEGGFGSTGA